MSLETAFPIIIPHTTYSTLNIRQDLSKLDREVGLLRHLSSLGFNHLLNYSSSHQGYVPIEASKFMKRVIVMEYRDSLTDQLRAEGLEVIQIIDHKTAFDVLRIEDEEMLNPGFLSWPSPKETSPSQPILLWNGRTEITDYTQVQPGLYIPNRFDPKILKDLSSWDNLLCLVLMVKNACGSPEAEDSFRQVLRTNMAFIDQWLVLDTGSTDRTIEVVKEILESSAIPGNLHQEPFINFRESRNRSLELAGTRCHFLVVLDDTYTLQGNVREFLQLVRGDTFADSFTARIKSEDGKLSYGSNRILRSKKGLRYKYRIHEIIEDNINVAIPESEIWILDHQSDYMKGRTAERKNFDLKLLEETWDEDNNDPRTLYYIAQTYTCLEKWAEARDYFNRRIHHPVRGYFDEWTDSHYERALISEHYCNVPWEICHQLYLEAWKVDSRRVESLFCIADHYVREGRSDTSNISFLYLRQAWETVQSGITVGIEVSSRTFLYHHHIPRLLAPLCYSRGFYEMGKKAAIQANLTNWTNIYTLIEQGRAESRVEYELPYDSRKTLFICAPGGYLPWNGRSINEECLGGSETWVVKFSEEWAKTMRVLVFCNIPRESGTDPIQGVYYLSLKEYPRMLAANQYRVNYAIVSRFADYVPVSLLFAPMAKIYFIVHDVHPIGEVIIPDPRLKILCLSKWHKKQVLTKFPVLDNMTQIVGNGVQPFIPEPILGKTSPIFIYSSMPNRGLIHLLKMFPTITARYPNAMLHVFADTQQEFVQNLCPDDMREVDRMLKEQGANVMNHGRVSQEVLRSYWREACIWLYPCTWPETSCITAVEAFASRTISITNDLGALSETCAIGGYIIPGNASSKEWQTKALALVFNLLDEKEDAQQKVEAGFEWSKSRSYKELGRTDYSFLGAN